MTLKSYNQSCPLACALDVVGDRWTLLVIRSLLAGPARFGEIQAQLPGIGSNLLSARLKLLTGAGVVTKTGGDRQSAYALSHKGEALRPIAHQLARWGREYLPREGKPALPQWSMFNLEAAFVPERSHGIDAVVQLTLAGFTFHLVVRRQACRAVAGAAVAPDLIIESESPELSGSKSRIRMQGDPGLFNSVSRCFDV